MAFLRANRSQRRGRARLIVTFALLAAIVAGGGYAYWRYSGDGQRVADEQLVLSTVESGPFDHIVLEQGEIESSSNKEVICEVKSRGSGGTSILWVIDEGAAVQKGEKLVELDSSQLETELKQQKIVVNNAKATLSSAEALLQQARIARQEYLEGTYRTEEALIQSEIAIAQQELRKAQLNLQSTEKMVAKGLVNALQMEGDQFGVANARTQLESATERLRVLQDLTKQKMLVQYDSDIDAAVASREAARSILSEEEEKLAEIEQQIKACVMYAPASGVVVHANEYSRRGGSEFVVEPGSTVRERQTIIRLPDPDQMQVKAKINESRITLVREGMPVKIRVDAVEGLELSGRVRKVNRYAEPGSWFSSSTKEYACLIDILDPPETIRTGMTAEARIFVDQRDDALQIPIQGVYEHYGDTYTLIRNGEDEFETRQIKLGPTNDTVAVVEDGLEEGERVVLNLRSYLDYMDLPEPDPDERRPETDQTPESQLAYQEDGPSNSGGSSESRGGGDMPSVADMVNGSFERFDTDGDGAISSEELAAMDERARGMAGSADTDGDGQITRSEMTAAMAKVVARMRSMRQGGGRPGPANMGG